MIDASALDLTGTTTKKLVDKADTGQGWDWGVPDYSATNQTNLGGLYQPAEWNQASQTYGNLAGGGGGYGTPYMPEQWTQAGNYANQWAQNGQPTTTADWQSAARQQTQYDIMDAIRQANEQSGLTGMRWSTPNARTGQDIAARGMAQYNLGLSQQDIAAQEAAKNRQMQGWQGLGNIGQGMAGLYSDAQNRALQAQLGGAAGLTGMGNIRAQYPLTVAQTSANIAGQQQNAQQQQLNGWLQELQRLMPENSQWNQYALQAPGAVPSQYAQNQYQPSGLSQLLGMLSGGALTGGALGLFGGGMPTTPQDVGLSAWPR